LLGIGIKAKVEGGKKDVFSVSLEVDIDTKVSEAIGFVLLGHPFHGMQAMASSPFFCIQ
jgi:hypothetical protein